MIMISLKPIPKGQQIFNDFSQLPRSDLFVSRRLEEVFFGTASHFELWDISRIEYSPSSSPDSR